MPTIKLITLINAPIERCYNLARSIDLHVKSMATSGEKAIAGRVTGLINLNETVTWKAKHFSIPFTLTSKISEMEYPFSFTDEMTEGPFQHFHHQHLFKTLASKTEMIDIFDFKAPLGLFGSIAERCFLKSYMTSLLEKRNQIIKQTAEQQETPANLF
ncbi:SRPBCC family protein [Pedobacter sandarakinus]|uniref:SRPBCC family protein n=1 Tax=Pedobacter sandarakinus TaxID=353156 RepID=UPI00224564C2|nr:SRPBCC family protein [Pedobacter sandarakinus]MCX2573981.1 SRPBCC family protein [Pedobacter sandarakinus]